MHPGLGRVPLGQFVTPQCLVPPRTRSAGMVGLHLYLQTTCPQGQWGSGSGPSTPAGAGTAIHLGCPLSKALGGALFPSPAQLLSP